LTSDIDFFLRATLEKADATSSASRAFEFGSLEISRQDLSKPDQIVQLGPKPNRIDLLTAISGVPFEGAWAGRCTGNIDGIPVQFIGRVELLHNKESTGGPKHLSDAAELRKWDTKQ